MTPPAFQLPDDIETLKAFALSMAEKAALADALEAEVANLKAQNADADERIGRLIQILKAFDRARFGRRSEKLGSPAADNEQQAVDFEEIETGIAIMSEVSSKVMPLHIGPCVTKVNQVLGAPKRTHCPERQPHSSKLEKYSGFNSGMQI